MVRISLDCGIVFYKQEKEMVWELEVVVSREVFLGTTVAVACL